MKYQCLMLTSAEEVILGWPQKHRDKINDFLRLLEEKNGVLDEPYSRHIKGKIRELRTDFGKTKYRILYALIPEKKILILFAFRKNTAKTPQNVIAKAEKLFDLYLQQSK